MGTGKVLSKGLGAEIGGGLGCGYGGDRRGRLERWTGAACYAEELTLTSSSQGSATAGFNLGKTRPALWFRNLRAAG